MAFCIFISSAISRRSFKFLTRRSSVNSMLSCEMAPFQAPSCCAAALPHSVPSMLPPCSLYAPSLLPLTPFMLPPAPSCSLLLPRCSLAAPSLLPLKRLCSLSRTKRAITDPKFGVFIIYIYIYIMYPGLRMGDCRSRAGKGAGPPFKGAVVPTARSLVWVLT